MASSTPDPPPLNPEVLEVLSSCRTAASQFDRVHHIIEHEFTHPEETLPHQLPVIVRELPCLSSFTTVLIGSSGEGLSLTELSESGYCEELDLTLILKTMTLTENEQKAKSNDFGQVQYSEKFPGHAFIRINNAETATKWCALSDIVTNETGSVNEFYLSPVAVTDEMYLMLSYRYSMTNLCYLEKCEQADRLMTLGNSKDFASTHLESGSRSDENITKVENKQHSESLKHKQVLPQASLQPGTNNDGYSQTEEHGQEGVGINEHNSSGVEMYGRNSSGVGTDDTSSLAANTEPQQIQSDQDQDIQEVSLFRLLLQEGPAIKTSIFCDAIDCVMQYDVSAGIHMLEWPSVAQAWITRSRTSGWPHKSLINDVTATGCLFVPKSPNDTKTNREWRISFCVPEKLLIQKLSEHQKICYIILKAIWRQFLKPPAGKGLQSYHLKTVFLWECERIPSEAWHENNYSVRILGLLESLKKLLDDQCCPHYFLPENNLFQDIENSVIVRAAERVQTSISEANVVWINNETIFYLPPQHTRTGMGKTMHKLYIKTLTTMCEVLTRAVVKQEENEPVDSPPTDILDDHSTEVLQNCIQECLGEDLAEYVVEYLKESSMSDEHHLIRTYMCSRSSPKELVKAAKLGVLNSFAELVSLVMAWGTMIDFVVSLDVLKNENLSQYGFSETYASEEQLRITVEHSLFNVFENSPERLTQARNFFDLSDIDDEESEEDGEADEEYICDCCESVIAASRYHCAECEDFDLCRICYEANTAHQHVFTCISDVPGKSEVLYTRNSSK